MRLHSIPRTSENKFRGKFPFVSFMSSTKRLQPFNIKPTRFRFRPPVSLSFSKEFGLL